MDASFLLVWLGSTLLPLGTLWLVYRLALRRERCFGYNRALLLLAPLLAAGLPLLPLPSLPAWLVAHDAPSVALPPVLLPALPAATPVAAVGSAGWSWVIWVYAMGVGLALGRLAYQAWRLHQATRRLPREARPGYTVAYTGGQLPTSSFGRTIFWDETAGLAPAEATSVLVHELAHVRQGHSLDVLWLELWRAVLWPNPFAHLLLPDLRLTHELLADQAAAHLPTPLAPTETAVPYSALLARLALRGAARGSYTALLQPFTFSFTLTRIAMLQNQIPVRRWKQWLVLPVLGGLFFLGSHAALAQVTPVVTPVPDEAQQKAWQDDISRKRHLAEREDSMRTGGKFEPGTTQQVNITYGAKPGQDVVTITRVPIPSASPQLTTSSGQKVYAYADQMPALPGKPGMAPIVQQILDNFVYPTGPHQEGRVFASFTVTANGNVTDAKIVKSLAPTYDAALLAAIEKLPRFVPGKQSGHDVAVSFTVPILFKKKP